MNILALSTDPLVWLGAFLTLCVFSFLYRDNVFYKLAEHLLVGFSTGGTPSFAGKATAYSPTQTTRRPARPCAPSSSVARSACARRGRRAP